MNTGYIKPNFYTLALVYINMRALFYFRLDYWLLGRNSCIIKVSIKGEK